MKRVRLHAYLYFLMLLIPGMVSAQANNWTIFPSKQLNCNSTPPGAISALSANPVGYTYNEVENSAYYSGSLLFSVNQDGIFDASGNNVYTWQSFSSTFTPPWHAAMDTTTGATTEDTYASSEIEIFPVPTKCRNYYVMLWAASNGYHPSGAYTSDLRLIQVDASTSTPTVVNDYILQNASGDWWGIVADKENADNSRDVYTISDSIYVDIAGHYQYPMIIKKWTFNADGTLSTGYPDPTVFPPVIAPADVLPPVLPLSNVPYHEGNVVELSPGGDLAVITRKTVQTDYLFTVNVHTGSSLGTTHAYFSDYVQLRGFEFVPSLNSWYVSWSDSSALVHSSDINCCFGGNGGGIGFFPVGSSTLTKVTSSTVSMTDFAKTDLELSKNGYLYMSGDPTHHLNVYGATTLGGPLVFNTGYLAYINTNGLTLSTAATAAPAYIGTPASTTVNGLTDFHMADIDHGNNYYLQNQIDADNYSSYYSSTSTAGGVTIDGHPVTPPGTLPCHPEQVKAGLGKLTFTPALSPAEEVQLDVFATDSCGNSIYSVGYVSLGPFPYTHGPITNLDLGAATNGLLSSRSALGNYYMVNISVVNSCTHKSWNAQAVVHIECNADFVYSFDTRYPYVVKFAPDIVGSGPFTWQFGPTPPISSDIVYETFSGPGTQDVSLTVNDLGDHPGCTTNTSMCINPVDYGAAVSYPCDADFTWTLYTDASRSSLISVVADNSVPVAAPGTYWTWNFGDGSPTVNGSSATHTYPPGPGTYHACLYTGVTPNGPCEICNYICVNNFASGTGHKSANPLNIANLNSSSQTEISNIYPNPAIAELNIDLVSNGPKNVTIRMYDVTGRLLSEDNKSIDNGKQTITLTVESLTAGVYNIELFDGQSIIRKKFVKQ